MLQALLFDVDGTVAETEGLHRRAFNRAFAEHGLELRWGEGEYRRLLAVTGGKERIARSLTEHATPCPAAAVAAIHASKTAIYEALLREEGAPWRPGMRRLMGEAPEAGMRLALVTTTSEANLDPLFAPVMGPAWRASFGAIVAGEAVARKKPAPDAYREALRRLALAPDRTVAFEDSRSGVLAARAAGVPVIALPSRWLPDDDLTGADLVLEDLGEVGAPWEAPHPALGARWLSAEGLAAWHARRPQGQRRHDADTARRSPCLQAPRR